MNKRNKRKQSARLERLKAAGIELVQVFNYEVVLKESLLALPKHKEHHRLRVFFHKGVSCVTCGRTGTQLVHGKDVKGSTHIDLCDDELYPLTIDHIVRRRDGGSDDLDNLQPMCTGCNTKKN